MDDTSAQEWLDYAGRVATCEISDIDQSFYQILNRFIESGIASESLDSWLPLGDSEVQYVVGCFLLGVTDDLATCFSIPRQVAKYAMAMSAINCELFSGKPSGDVLQLLLNLPEIAKSDNSVLLSLHTLGVLAACKWRHKGMAQEPPTSEWHALVKMLGRSVPSNIRDPNGALNGLRTLLNNDRTSASYEEIFRREPAILMTAIAKHYPLALEKIEELALQGEFIDASLLASNRAISWTPEFLDSYGFLLDWATLSENQALPWSVELIERFEDSWNWLWLSYNPNLPWSQKLIRKYKDRWNWKHLSANKSLPWNEELVNEYADKLNWDSISYNPKIPWSVEFIDAYGERLNREYLSLNEGLPWSSRFIKQCSTHLSWNDLCENPKISWEMLCAQKRSFDWSALSKNQGLPWSLDFIDQHNELWNWSVLSKNPGLPWTNELIECYKDMLDWEALSANTGLPWSYELLEKYEDRWQWKADELFALLPGFGIYTNRAIRWTPLMLARFCDSEDLAVIATHFDFDVRKLPAEKVDILMREL